jgi:hypothetical protein
MRTPGWTRTGLIGLIHYGCIFFGLEKMAADGPNPAVYAQMRRDTEELKSRNVSMQA